MTKKKILSVIASLFAFSIILSPTLAKADILIKKTKHTEATVMGQPQPVKDEKGITWIAKDKIREEMGESLTIVRFDLNKIYIIDHSKKSYSEIDLPIEFDKVVPPEAKHMIEMVKMTSSSVTDTGETQTIRGWKCKKFLVEVEISIMAMNIPMKMEIWTSKDLGIDLNTYKKFSSTFLSLNPFTKDLSEEVKKIEGFPVLTISSMAMTGTETKEREEVVAVEKKDAPANTYNLPTGYKKIPSNPFK